MAYTSKVTITINQPVEKVWDTNSKLIVFVDNGVLKQPLNQDNDFPKNFIIVPDGLCN